MINLSLSDGTQYEATPTQTEAPRLFRVKWDDEIADYGYKCRTQMADWKGPDNPPAVIRFYPEPREKSGDYRVNLASPYDWKSAIVTLNDGDEGDWGYLIGPARATYNTTGWPQQAYLTMSGNVLQGERVGDWLRFVTLKQSDVSRVGVMNPATHRQFVQHFTCVTWDRRTRTTKRIDSTGTPRGQVYWFLVTKEGEAWIPYRMVVPL